MFDMFKASFAITGKTVVVAFLVGFFVGALLSAIGLNLAG